METQEKDIPRHIIYVYIYRERERERVPFTTVQFSRIIHKIKKLTLNLNSYRNLEYSIPG